MNPITPKRSTLEYALLGLIRGRPQSGYDLRKVFEETAMAGYSGSPGAIYPALRRMEGRGWIATNASEPTGRRRQEYRLAESGRDALADWLALPVTREDVALRLPELMLRFVFLAFDESGFLTPLFLDQFRSHVADYMDELCSQRDELPLTAHARLALECGISSLEAHRLWAVAARDELKQHGDEQ
jgi:DNA-binding PadR family transcriptional regulator